ncbi:hypothetical protein PSTT_03059 [Puccinia striiformis]|uniref:Uncharacterized protein n=1 Tax=Puccinia striiformis TaxID=27350 RepID=A0A2S4VXU2_9BASI|nr:hypothetical protein PSTT_03059 [Puccinia striiformis]
MISSLHNYIARPNEYQPKPAGKVAGAAQATIGILTTYFSLQDPANPASLPATVYRDWVIIWSTNFAHATKRLHATHEKLYNEISRQRQAACCCCWSLILLASIFEYVRPHQNFHKINPQRKAAQSPLSTSRTCLVYKVLRIKIHFPARLKFRGSGR